MDQESFTHTQAEFTAKGEQNIIGTFTGNAREQIGAKNSPDCYPVTPFKDSTGTRVYNAAHMYMPNLGAFAISRQSKYPLEAMRWIDFWYGPEGAKLGWIGIEGVTYTVQPDGSYLFTDLILKNPNGLNQAQAIGQYLLGWSGGGIPIVADLHLDWARRLIPQYEGYELAKKYLNVKALPILTFTLAEQQELNPIQTDLITYLDESRVQFVTGRKPFSQWDAYVNDIRRMGADRFVAVYQTAWDRFNK